ncbi:MAG: 3-hydroxyacyl-CoA dehydrogenase, partial [Deferrisomatales bacterium]
QTVADLTAEGRPIPQHPGHGVVAALVEAHGRPGRAAGRGFYDYPEGGRKRLWPGLGDLYPLRDPQLPQDDLMDRLLLCQSLEAVRCLDEGVLTSVADANLGSVYGWGFPPFKGGVLQFINDRGLAAFAARSRELAERWGDRFAPPASLEERARRGQPYA